jgi:uncharacterized protein (TIGR00369 family)
MDARKYGIVDREAALSESGLEFIQGMIDGRHPHPPICELMGFHFVGVKPGYVRLEALPELRHYNPIGSVHAGFAATVLDTASGAAIFSSMQRGEAWTTLELKLNFVRQLTHETGLVYAEGRVIHRGRTVATAEGDVKDSAGRLYAHATTTCLIFPPKNT